MYGNLNIFRLVSHGYPSYFKRHFKSMLPIRNEIPGF
jgi:hypothetical protein